MMTEMHPVDDLKAALNDRALAGEPVKFWLRDDDAVQPTASLDRLLELVHKFSIPLTIAVIPKDTGRALAERLAMATQVSVAAHGWSHTNYAGVDEKKQELGNHRPHDVVLTELQLGLSRLTELHGSRFVPMLVPPWNRISGEIVARLDVTGFEVVSTFGKEKSAGGPLYINTHVDIMDWKGSRGGKDFNDLIVEIVARLREGSSKIGVLSHHLVHDETAWFFLEQFFATTSAHPGARWYSSSDLLSAEMAN